MIKIRRNCKEIEGRSFGARKNVKTGEKQWSARFHSLTEASAKSALCCETISQPPTSSLRNHHFAPKSLLCCEIISQPQAPLYENFRSYEEPSWHTSAISQHSNLNSQLRNGCEIPKCKNSQFRSQSANSKGVSQLQNHPLAHECHFAAPYTHFATAKWLRNDLQAAKWPSSCEIDLQNGGRFAKTPCKSQGKLLKCQQSPATMHLKRRAPRTLGSHTPSLSLHF